MATELTDLELGEWSICIDPANEDCTIEIVKSKSGLGPALMETDMSEQNDHIDNDEGDADFEAFANENGDEILQEFSALSEDDQAAALVALTYDNAVQAESLEGITKAAQKVADEHKALQGRHEELKKSALAAATLIEKMKSEGKVGDADAGPLSELRKSLTAGGAALSDEAEARISEVEKSLAKQAQAEAIAKAKTYGFGKADEVADLETGIRKALGDKKADAFVAIVKQAGEIAKKSPLFKSIGEDAGADADVSPITKMKGAAAEIRKAKPQLTEQQAMSEAIEANPALYTEYQRSLGSSQRVA